MREQSEPRKRPRTESDIRAAYLGPPAAQRLRGVDRILNREVRAIAVYCLNEGDGLARVAPACPPSDVGKVGRVDAELGGVDVCKVCRNSHVVGCSTGETERWWGLLREREHDTNPATER